METDFLNKWWCSGGQWHASAWQRENTTRYVWTEEETLTFLYLIHKTNHYYVFFWNFLCQRFRQAVALPEKQVEELETTKQKPNGSKLGQSCLGQRPLVTSLSSTINSSGIQFFLNFVTHVKLEASCIKSSYCPIKVMVGWTPMDRSLIIQR